MSLRATLSLALAVLIAAPAHSADRCAARSGANVVPLVELYTSEGCSSCPPADRWLSTAQARLRDVNFIAFHVDYWDDIGWPDRFASPGFSQRQRARVNALGGSTVYTPQVMVGDAVNATWRADRSFDATLAAQRTRAPVALAITLAEGRAIVGAARTGAATPPAVVWLARVSDGEVTQVRAGENRGATLRHDRVVRALYGPWTLGDTPLSRTQALPPLSGAGGLVAFAQDARGRTLQSLALPTAACTGGS